MLDRSSRERIQRRVRELDGSPVGHAPRTPESATGLPDLHRRLWRDTSAILALLGAVLAVAVATTQVQSPSAGVLGVTAAPSGGLAVIPPSSTAPQQASPGATATVRASDRPESLAPTPSPVATRTPPVSATPAPAHPTASADTSDRMAVLRPCSGTPDCYIYVVRRGDNLVSIANWFGIPYEEVLARNQQIKDPGRVHAGDRITLPRPRR